MTHIIAVDPGGTTGWAMCSLVGSWNPAYVVAGQMPAESFCDWMADRPSVDGCLLVVESFTVTAQTARLSPQPEPMEVIGVLKFLARRGGARLELQTPAAAKRFVSDAQLKKLGLWQPGKDHARDAIRHLVLGIATFETGQIRQELLECLV